ncbi:hypothetical protein NEMBOFW57_010769 [Staphylotrichum longicolle]|uniref:Uncharacterized protein n=1 Tax=Staphylotrichum longicolle TaxID=669026 RepID=A0AAD4ENC9_9PEZI|nr:hypothetical protein NEMBOFW57_010769 [Staphylotrichum longicolle]
MDLRNGSRQSNELQFHCDLARVQSRAVSGLMRQVSAEAVASPGCAITLHALIKTYDAELNCFALRLSGERRILSLNSARLHVNSFLFFTADDTQALDHDGLVELYYTAYKVIMGTKATYPGKSSGPDYANWSKLLAAFIILKISRSCLASRVDLRAGEKAYFATILEFRESSLGNDDLCARGAMVLGQLWSSTRVFRRPDGVVDGLALRIRSRLSMGIVHDCFWWWREEFQGKANPYNAQRKPASEGTSLFHLSDAVALGSNSAATPGQEILNEMDVLRDLTGLTGLTMPEDLVFAI